MDGPVLSISGGVLYWPETPPSSRNLRKSRRFALGVHRGKVEVLARNALVMPLLG